VAPGIPIIDEIRFASGFLQSRVLHVRFRLRPVADLVAKRLGPSSPSFPSGDCPQERRPVFDWTGQCHGGRATVVFPPSDGAGKDGRETATRGAFPFVMDDGPSTTRTAILVTEFEEDAYKCERATGAVWAFGIDVDGM
jgi:hypothetical protein